MPNTRPHNEIERVEAKAASHRMVLHSPNEPPTIRRTVDSLSSQKIRCHIDFGFRMRANFIPTQTTLRGPKQTSLQAESCYPYESTNSAMIRNREAMAIIAQLGLNRESRS